MTSPQPQHTMSSFGESVQRILVMREMFPKCYYCAASIRHTRIGELVKVDGKNRLAHKLCPSESE